MKSVSFEEFPGRTLQLGYFINVKNSESIRKAMMNGGFDAALMNARLVVDLFAIEIAAARTLLCEKNKSLTTTSIHSELVYNLSGSRNVTESFRRFGISDASDSLVVGVFDATMQDFEALTATIEAEQVSMDLLGEHLTSEDEKKLKKYYKIQPEEMAISDLSQAIVTRIAIKSCTK